MPYCLWPLGRKWKRGIRRWIRGWSLCETRKVETSGRRGGGVKMGKLGRRRFILLNLAVRSHACFPCFVQVTVIVFHEGILVKFTDLTVRSVIVCGGLSDGVIW